MNRVFSIPLGSTLVSFFLVNDFTEQSEAKNFASIMFEKGTRLDDDGDIIILKSYSLYSSTLD